MAATISGYIAIFLADGGYWLIIRHGEKILSALLRSGVSSETGHFDRLQNRQAARDR
jgi:hypothetical protein